MKAAHTAGQYQSLADKADLYPYWQYHTREDSRVRDSHAVLNGKVFRHDDPFWDTHFPPNGWKCRCYVRSLDDDDLEEKGLKVLDSRDLKTREDKSAGGHTKLTYIIDGKEATTADGWNYNPGKVSQHIDAVADDKAEGYDPELGQQVKDDLNEEPKPAAPKKPSAAPGQPAKPSEPAKKTEPEKKAAPKSAADKAEEPKASGKPETKPAALPAKSEAAAPKSAQPTVKDSNVPVKSTTAAPKPAQPAVKPAAAPKPKQADGAHGEPKPAAAPKPIKPAPAPANKPDAPRIIEPIKPADPSLPRVIKPSKSGDPSIPRVAETVKPAEPPKPEAKQSILQTIRNKVGRAVNRVLGWLGVSSKWPSSEELANGDRQNTRYIDNQVKEAKPTAVSYTTKAQPQVVKDNDTPTTAQDIKAQASKENYDRIVRLYESMEPIPQLRNKGSVKQQHDRLYSEIEQSGNLPLKWKRNKPVITLGKNDEYKTVESITFYELGYNSIEEAQSAIHNKTLEHAIVFDKNNKCLSETIGRKGDVDFLYHGGAAYLVIHNHPDGTIFSPEDIICAIKHGIHELRVLCNGDGIYAFRPYKDGKLVIGPNKVRNELKHWLEQGAIKSMSTPFPEHDENDPNEIKRANDLWNEECKHVAQDFVAQHFPGMVKIQ